MVEQYVKLNTLSTQDACAESDGNVADLLWLANVCTSTQAAFLLWCCYSRPFIFLHGEFAFNNDK